MHGQADGASGHVTDAVCSDKPDSVLLVQGAHKHWMTTSYVLYSNMCSSKFNELSVTTLCICHHCWNDTVEGSLAWGHNIGMSFLQ